MKLIILLFISFQALSQGYEYAELTTVKIGHRDRDNVSFFLSNEDSSRYYNSLKIKHIVPAIELMERKGWELITITNSQYQVIITTAYLRRHARKH